MVCFPFVRPGGDTNEVVTSLNFVETEKPLCNCANLLLWWVEGVCLLHSLSCGLWTSGDARKEMEVKGKR